LTRIALLTTTETDLLSARASGADYVYGNPAKLDVAAVETLIDGADLIVFRFLGGKEQLPATFTTCTESGLPLVVLGGQHTPDATLMELSSVPMGVAAQAHHYFVQGGVGNLRNVHAFLSDTVLLTGDAFEPVEQMPVWSELPRPEAPTDEPDGHRRPRVGIIFYRAHYAAGNIKHIVALSDAIDAAGGRAVPIQTASLRDPDPGLIEFLGTCDAIITTVQASGGLTPADASAGGDEGAWDVEQLAKLSNQQGNVAILQGDPTQEAAQQRTKGCEEIAAKYNMKVVFNQTGLWMRDKGLALAENLIQSGQQVDVICANNDEMALGAINAFENAGMLDKVVVGGVDATGDALAAMAAGKLEVTVFQDAKGQGQAGVDTAIKMINGDEVPDVINVPYQLVTPENMSQFQQ